MYLQDLERWAESQPSNQPGNPGWNFEPLREAVLQFNADAREFEKWEHEWENVVYGSGGFESTVLEAHRISHNNRMANFETHLLDLEEGGGVRLLTPSYIITFSSLLSSLYHFIISSFMTWSQC